MLCSEVEVLLSLLLAFFVVCWLKVQNADT
jgi:hypothetical protein